MKRKILIMIVFGLIFSGCATGGFSRFKSFVPEFPPAKMVYLMEAKAFESYERVSRERNPASIRFFNISQQEKYLNLASLFENKLKQELKKARFVIVEQELEADLILKPKLYFRPMTFITVGDVMMKILVKDSKGKELMLWGVSNPLAWGGFNPFTAAQYSLPEKAITERENVETFIEDLKTFLSKTGD